jgi:hypothetical protein
LTEETRFTIFLVIWILLGLGIWLFLALQRDARLKHHYFRWFLVGAGVLFIAGIAFMGFPFETFVLMVPAVALITYLNIRLTKFCQRCGAINFNYLWFGAMNYCRRCGASLKSGEASPPPEARSGR